MVCRLKLNPIIFIAPAIALASIQTTFAQTKSVESTSEPTTLPDEVGNKEQSLKSTSAENGIQSWGMSFGLGLEKFRNNYIERASINGESRVVIVEKKFDEQASGWLTLNWRPEKFVHNNYALGFYVGVKITGASGNAFDGFSFGPQVSFRVSEGSPINIGFGWVAHQTRKLATGIVDGEPLPKHFDEIKFRETTENSWMVMVSKSF